jgi:hypothetical protein
MTSSSAPLNFAGSVDTILTSMLVGGGEPSLINGASSLSSSVIPRSEIAETKPPYVLLRPLHLEALVLASAAGSSVVI